MKLSFMLMLSTANEKKTSVYFKNPAKFKSLFIMTQYKIFMRWVLF